MKALLVRVGIDRAYGNWNAPVCAASNKFVYVPIPEQIENPAKIETQFQPGLATSFDKVLPALNSFATEMGMDLAGNLRFPQDLTARKSHLDPDFEYLSYGDEGNRRGARMRDMRDGDVLAFYAGFRPVRACEHRLVYALLGLYVVEEVVFADDVEPSRWIENAHTRKLKRGTSDIVVRAKRGLSRRLERCVPIGEFRDRAYRVRPDILDVWGGLSVQNGYIQRSAVPPEFLKPQQFYQWFLDLKIPLLERNN